MAATGLTGKGSSPWDFLFAGTVGPGSAQRSSRVVVSCDSAQRYSDATEPYGE